MMKSPVGASPKAGPASSSTSAARGSKRCRAQPGPQTYEEVLDFASHAVGQAIGQRRIQRYGQCKFGLGILDRGIMLSSDFSGIGCAEVAASLVKDFDIVSFSESTLHIVLSDIGSDMIWSSLVGSHMSSDSSRNSRRSRRSRNSRRCPLLAIVVWR